MIMKRKKKIISAILTLVFLALVIIGVMSHTFSAGSYKILQWSALNHHTTLSRILLLLGTPPSPYEEIYDWYYFAEITDTPLHTAARSGDIALARALIEHGASVDWCCCECVTPLHIAILDKNPEMVDLLLQAGASTDIPYDLSMSAQELAERRGTSEIVGLIVRHNSQVDVEGRKSPDTTLTAPTHLIPCKKLFELAPHMGVYNRYFAKRFREDADLEHKVLFFTMYTLPAFDPESIILAYGMPDGDFFVESFTATKSIWASLNSQAMDRYSDIWHVPEDATFVLPPFHSNERKRISARTAAILKQTLDFVMERSRFDRNELKSWNGYLDSTMVLFVAADKKCGWPSWWIDAVPEKRLLSVGDLLKKYVTGQARENDIVNSAMKVVNHKSK